MSQERLQGRIAAKLEGKGVEDLLAMLRGITAQDTEALRAEVETLTAQLLALAVERRGDLGERLAAALVKAARTVQADAEPDAFAFLGEGEEGDSLEEFLIADLVGLGHQIAGAVGTQEPEEGAALLRLSSRLMAAGAAVLEGTSPTQRTSEASEASAGAWLQLANAEGMVRRLAALVVDALQSNSLGLPKDDEDRWATAVVILSGSLEGLADTLKAERGRRPRQTFWNLDVQQWIRLVAATLVETAVRLGPALEDDPSSPLVRALVQLAEIWEQVAEQQDGQAALDRALLAPSWSNLLTLASIDRRPP